MLDNGCWNLLRAVLGLENRLVTFFGLSLSKQRSSGMLRQVTWGFPSVENSYSFEGLTLDCATTYTVEPILSEISLRVSQFCLIPGLGGTGFINFNSKLVQSKE